jgi:hypothetical protein
MIVVSREVTRLQVQDAGVTRALEIGPLPRIAKLGGLWTQYVVARR